MTIRKIQMIFLSRMAKQTASYSIMSKNDTEILLQLRHAAKTEATSLLDDEVVLADCI